MSEKKQYEVEELLEMLGGDQYYSMNQIMYVYHTLRGEHEEADYYTNEMERNAKNYERKLRRLRRANEKLEVELPKDDDVKIDNLMVEESKEI